MKNYCNQNTLLIIKELIFQENNLMHMLGFIYDILSSLLTTYIAKYISFIIANYRNSHCTSSLPETALLPRALVTIHVYTPASSAVVLDIVSIPIFSMFLSAVMVTVSLKEYLSFSTISILSLDPSLTTNPEPMTVSGVPTDIHNSWADSVTLTVTSFVVTVGTAVKNSQSKKAS